MKEKLNEWLQKANRWIQSHWRLTIAMLLTIIVMQQCTINRLRWEIEQVTRPVSAAPLPTPMQENRPVTTDTLSDSLLIKTPPVVAKEADDGGTLWPLFFILILVSAVTVFLMRRRGIPPIGMRVSGRMRQTPEGEILFDLKVRNSSASAMDVSDPMINFGMRGGTRRFRANVSTLPITLQSGTTYRTSIKLTGLIMGNPELSNSRYISVNVLCNGRRRTTLPHPIRIEQQ